MAFKKAKKWIVYTIIAVISGNLEAMQEREVKKMSLDEVFAKINAKIDKELTLDKAYSLIWAVMHDPDTYLSDPNSVAELMILGAPIITKTKLILDNPAKARTQQIQNAMIGNAILFRLSRLKHPQREKQTIGMQFFQNIRLLAERLPINLQNAFTSRIQIFMFRTSAWADALQFLYQFHKGITPASTEIERVIFLLYSHQTPGEKEKELVNSLLELLPENDRERVKALLGLVPQRLIRIEVPLITQVSDGGERPGGIPFPVGGGRGGEEALRRVSGLPQEQPTSWTARAAKRFVQLTGALGVLMVLYDYWQKSEKEKTRKRFDPLANVI